MVEDHVLELEFEKLKDTKNKIRYDEVTVDDDPPVVGSLYVVKKQAESLGDKIRVTIGKAS